MKAFCFGDSHGFGSELNNPQIDEHPFIHWFAESLNIPYENFSQEGSSLGIIQYKVIKELHNITKDDIVLVVIPPDSRWYDENEEQGFYSLSNYMIEDYYEKFLNKKTLEWFEYHHALFTYTIQQLLKGKGCRYMMVLSYGRLGGKHYDLDIDYTKFLDYDIRNLLGSEGKKWDNYPHDIEPKEHRFMYDGPPEDTYNLTNNPYYKGTEGHPNELGHKKLAELFLEKYNEDNL